MFKNTARARKREIRREAEKKKKKIYSESRKNPGQKQKAAEDDGSPVTGHCTKEKIQSCPSAPAKAVQHG